MSSTPQRDKAIDEGRAAVLLGVSRAELRRLSRETGVGHEESGEENSRLMFTYEEIYRLCQAAALAH